LVFEQKADAVADGLKPPLVQAADEAVQRPDESSPPESP